MITYMNRSSLVLPVKIGLIAIVSGILSIPCYGKKSAAFDLSSLKVSGRTSPLGIDIANPTFSWQVKSPKRGFYQKSYRLRVTDPQGTVVWDTGTINSDIQNNIEYSGAPLKSSTPYRWEVTVTDSDNNTSSAADVFETSFMSPDDWSAYWIAPDDSAKAKLGNNVPYFGKSINIPEDKNITRARLYSTALGVYSVKINGNEVTENRMEPGETEFGKSIMYNTYDVTPLLRNGSNSLIGQLAGGIFNVTPLEGRYSKGEIQNRGTSALLAQLVIDYADGSSDTIVTDKSWKCALSPTTGSNWWGGEDYDASKRYKDMDRGDFGFDGWFDVKEIIPVFEYPHVHKSFSQPGVLKAKGNEPLRVVETWQADSVWQLPNGDYMVDFGRNFAGTYKFKLSGRKGQKIRLQESERLDTAGYCRIDYWYTGPGVVYEEFTFDEDGKEEVWGPEFMYHGFRYMQISGLDTMPSPSAFTAERIRSDVEPAGSFDSSNGLLNSIHVICRDAIQSQLYNTLTDCPHREKLGWLDVPQEMFNSLCFNYDLTTFWGKMVMDCFDAQGENGYVPSMAPWFMDVYADDPNWGGSAILVPYKSVMQYGDLSLVRRYYPEMKKLIEYYTTHLKDGIMENFSVLSDWGQSSCHLAVDTPTEFTITTTYYHLLQAMATMAKQLGLTKDAADYSQRAAYVKRAFNDRFFKEGDVYNNGNQAEYGMALYYGLVDSEKEEAVAARLAEKVKADDYRIRTGEIGLKPVLMSLAKYGYNDVVYKMANQTDYPSYGFFVMNGCTTTPEYWDLERLDNSHNHCMMDHIEEWFFSELGGIKNKGIAYKEFEISPWIPADMDHLEVNTESVYGTITSGWQKREAGGYDFSFKVPANTTAIIKIPMAATSGKVYENNKLVKAGKNGVESIDYTDTEAVIKVGSGEYSFSLRY